MTDNDLLPLLNERLLGVYTPLLADTTATLLFTAGGMANWTVEIDRGRSMARRGGPTNPSATVRAPLHVLDDVVSGKRSGVEAFLNGDLTVRGNLALALQLDGLFPSPDETRPVPHRDPLDERRPGSRRSTSRPGGTTRHRSC